MINSFSNKLTEELFNRQTVTKLPPSILKSAYRKLLLLDAVERLDDLNVPPANKLEKLFGDLAGKYSIRINDQ